MDETGGYRLHHQWKLSFVIASYAVSVLGAYTTTQLMCQSSSSRRLWKKVGWIAVASVSFGGTAIWAMHFVSMLAMNIGIPVQYDVTATIASALVAIIATFIAFSYDLLASHFERERHKRRQSDSDSTLQSPESIVLHSPAQSRAYQSIPEETNERDSSPLMRAQSKESKSASSSDDNVPLIANSQQSSDALRRRGNPTSPLLPFQKRDSFLDLTSIDHLSPQHHNSDGNIALSTVSLASSEPAAASPFMLSPPAATDAKPDATVKRQRTASMSSGFQAGTRSDTTMSSYGDSSVMNYDPMLPHETLMMIRELPYGNTWVGFQVWQFWYHLTPRVMAKGLLLSLTIGLSILLDP